MRVAMMGVTFLERAVGCRHCTRRWSLPRSLHFYTTTPLSDYFLFISLPTPLVTPQPVHSYSSSTAAAQ